MTIVFDVYYEYKGSSGTPTTGSARISFSTENPSHEEILSKLRSTLPPVAFTNGSVRVKEMKLISSFK